jgi:pSer/pThr/pTyr-binding forkhead associated (FHA) protein/predicted Ser/Thr protein kinase
MIGQQLRVIEGGDRGELVRVDDELLIGRAGPEDDAGLGGDPEISRRHAHVSRGADGRLTIEDLGSANGTFVNDARIDAPLALEHGDVVRVGRTVLEVSDDSGAPPAPSQALAGEPTAVRAVAGMALMVTAGTGVGRRLAVDDELVIGRGVSGEGQLREDLELSRRHVRVARDANGELSIEDLGSANGTFVNGERLSGRLALTAGDSIQIGSTTLELTGAAAPAAAPAPPPAAPMAPAAAPAPDPPAAPDPAPVADPAAGGLLAPQLPAGTVFAGCRVEEVIGQGDMGVVYGAEELALQRPVALKLIRPENSREERFRERFRRESRIAAAIDHPNVIPVFDAGDESGVLFIMMRLVEGTDLRALIAAEGRVDPLRAARIVRQVGAALDAAHARGMLHRDVKPSNVLLDGTDHVYLSDFGLAKQAATDGGLTQQGSIVARAEYVAPEQVLNEPVDQRVDVYALGCLLFEALTGEAPFATWRRGPAALAHVEAPRPSPLELCPELPSAFDDVVRRAMAIDPSERYQSAGELGQAALTAASGLSRARPRPAVAAGEAAVAGGEPGRRTHAAGLSVAAARDRAEPPRLDTLRWAIALAGLLIVAVSMAAALKGISSL